MDGLSQAGIRLLSAALLLAVSLQFGPICSAGEYSSDPDLSFVAVGGDAGLGLSEVLANLVKSKEVGLRPEIIEGSQAPIAAARASYGLQQWVDLSGLMDDLCDYNQGVCFKARGKSVWIIRQGDRAKIPSDACNGSRRQDAPPTFFCVPDVRMSLGNTIITRMVDSREAANLPSIIATNTKGCESFDISCQRSILVRNSSETAAWESAESAGLFSDNPTATASEPWWGKLSGKVALPAALIYAILPNHAGGGARSPLDRCNALEQIVKEGDKLIRAKRGIDAQYSFIVATDCRTVLANRTSLAARPRGFVGHVLVTQEFRNTLIREFRDTMKLTAVGPPSGGHPMIGIWDGVVANRLSLLRDHFARLTYTKAQPIADYKLLENSVVSWVDPFPAELFDTASGGPCGYFTEANHDGDHGTIVAAMIAGMDEGLLPGARLWAHQWNKRRLELGKLVGPRDSLIWFGANIYEAGRLGKGPYIANLSCGVDYDKGAETASWVSVKTHLNGLNTDNGKIVPYVVGVAAGNRMSDNDPANVSGPTDWNKIDFNNIDIALGGGGYPFLARQFETSGFISVVGLSPKGDDVLQCNDIQELLARSKEAGASFNETKIADFCPVSQGSATNVNQIPLVVDGTIFDVGAVGVGVGISEADNGPVIAWGSSFAAPYVTGLAAQIVERCCADRAPPDARLVADRIRFTADRIESKDVTLYGRINGERALSFETDQFERRNLPSDLGDTPDADFVQTCFNQQGRLELNRDKSGSVSLKLEDGTERNLEEIQRIRALDDHHPDAYEVMYRNPSYHFGPSVIVKPLAKRSVTLPVQCVRPNNTKEPKPIHLDILKSFTRCSFDIKGCK
jgi:subtilisin family serine protease